MTIFTKIANFIGTLCYEMTHVTEVGSRGYIAANIVGFAVWTIICAIVVALIYTDKLSNLIWEFGEFLERKGIQSKRNKN